MKTLRVLTPIVTDCNRLDFGKNNPLISAGYEMMAEKEGFEPPVGKNPRQFSRLLPSTTRPFLRISELVIVRTRT